MGRRADRVIHRVREAGSEVALFAHGHLLRVLLARWLGLDAKVGGRLALGTAALGVLARAEPTAHQLQSLTEDLWQARGPDGRYTVDVGWYPDLDPSGQFLCVVVRDGDWEKPVERFETRSSVDVTGWARAAVSRYSAGR